LPTPGRCTGYVIDHVGPLMEGEADETGQIGWDAIARTAPVSQR